MTTNAGRDKKVETMSQTYSPKKLVTLGSTNIDHILNMEDFPRPGETVKGQNYTVAFGGKGANQAVAAGRAGACITFLACLGDDAMGELFKTQLQNDRIDVSHIETVVDTTTGVALIFVNKDGENVIAINAGANKYLTPEYVLRHQDVIKNADALLMQLESPLESVLLAAQIAKENQTKVILNPAPGQKIGDSLLSLIDIITPNETEAEKLTDIPVHNMEDAKQASNMLHQKGIETVIITLGARGAWVSQNRNAKLIEGFKVRAIDTIAAGDTFNGTLITALLEGIELEEAVKLGHAAAALSVTRYGGQPSVPWREEINNFLREQEVLRH